VIAWKPSTVWVITFPYPVVLELTTASSPSVGY